MELVNTLHFPSTALNLLFIVYNLNCALRLQLFICIDGTLTLTAFGHYVYLPRLYCCPRSSGRSFLDSERSFPPRTALRDSSRWQLLWAEAVSIIACVSASPLITFKHS